ncbi:MAG: AAA family ATPase [Lentimicrobium sp.]
MVNNNNFQSDEFKLLEALDKIGNQQAIDIFYEKMKLLISRAGIVPDQVHASVRHSNLIAVTLGQRYVLSLSKKGDLLIWSMIINSSDIASVRTHPCFKADSYFNDKNGDINFNWAEFYASDQDAINELENLWPIWEQSAGSYYQLVKTTRLVDIYQAARNEALAKSMFDHEYLIELMEKKNKFSKLSPSEKLIEQYKILIRATGNKDELYKWELLGKKHWNLDDPDFLNMVKRIPFKNLVYPMGIAVLHHLGGVYPEEMRKLLKDLFNENVELSDRVKTFRTSVDNLYRTVEQKLPSHHDERTIASYLAYNNPEKYALYKNSFYAGYCKILGLRQAKKNDKFIHYMELINILISKYIKKDEELLQLYRSFKPENGFADSNLLLLAQDILFQTLDLTPENEEVIQIPGNGHVTDKPEAEEEPTGEPMGEPNFWWLNADPSIWSISRHAEGELQTYTTRNEKGNKRRIYKHFEAAQPGDLMIGYESSPVKQVKAIFEVTKGIHQAEREGEVIEFIVKEKLNIPVHWNELQNISALNDSEVFINNQGSLFRLTEDEFDIIREVIDNKNIVIDNPKGTYKYIDDPDKPFISESDFRQMINLLKRKKNIILQGPPGVGKTFIARKIAYEMIGVANDDNIEMVQFHQSYSYEDFIQGLRPGKNGFELKNGMFYTFCRKALAHPERKFFFIIDEINRGNLSKIFGELMMLIEHDKRHEKYALKLTYAEDEKDTFFIPSNLYIIGTMNTADRSLAIVDYALRRRFAFITLHPSFGEAFRSFETGRGLSPALIDRIIKSVYQANQEIAKDINLGEGFQIGHSYFCTYPGDNVDEIEWYNEVIEYEIKPLLEEIWFDDQEKVKRLLAEMLS